MVPKNTFMDETVARELMPGGTVWGCTDNTVIFT